MEEPDLKTENARLRAWEVRARAAILAMVDATTRKDVEAMGGAYAGLLRVLEQDVGADSDNLSGEP